jgi:hypothetical protein
MELGFIYYSSASQPRVTGEALETVWESQRRGDRTRRGKEVRKNDKKRKQKAGCWWLMLVILVTWEEEIRRIII